MHLIDVLVSAHKKVSVWTRLDAKLRLILVSNSLLAVKQYDQLPVLVTLWSLHQDN